MKKILTKKFYILKNRLPVECSPYAWGEAYQKPEKRLVSKTEINENISVSTSFTGIDYSPKSKAPPLLFETWVSGYSLYLDKDSYSSWEEAVEGHQAIVDIVKAQLINKGWDHF